MNAPAGARPAGAGSGTTHAMHRVASRLRLGLVLATVGAGASPSLVVGQEAGRALNGRVLVGDTALTTGMVVLHLISDESQGEIDSVAVAPDGGFRFTLPSVPSAAADRFYFASVRHSGIVYFGDAISRVEQLDSIYQIQAYDTAMVGPGGADISIQGRNVFFEPSGESWRVTDIFQLRNDTGRTLVAPDGAVVWRYPLLPGARDFTSGQGEFTFEGTILENDTVSVRAAIGPGERIMVFRYMVDDPFVTIATPGNVEALDVLVREPAPRLAVEGLELVGPVELEQGAVYRRYSGADVGAERVRVVQDTPPGELPMEWITVLVGMALAAAAFLIVSRRSGSGPAAGAARPARASTREELLLQIARLDEDFEAEASPSAAARATYRTRRAALMEELRALSAGSRAGSAPVEHTRRQ